MTPEQIVQKWAERLIERVNFQSAKETEARFKTELQPLADLIRAAQGVMADAYDFDGMYLCDPDPINSLRAALEKLAGE
jgi:hypothetical protein